jgi:hypothetical protein
MDLQIKKLKAILALDLKVIEEAQKESNPALDKEVILLRSKKASLEKKVAELRIEEDCLTEFIDWCKEHSPGLLEKAIGSNPQGWKKFLSWRADLEEGEEVQKLI